jgi:hypothetical protein
VSLLSRIFRRPSGQTLVGIWRQVDPDTMMIFGEDGQLEYRIVQSTGVQIMKLTYRVEGTEIVSDQPSSPREERTAFRFEGANVLARRWNLLWRPPCGLNHGCIAVPGLKTGPTDLALPLAAAASIA